MRLFLRIVATICAFGLLAAGTAMALAPSVSDVFTAGSASGRDLALDPLDTRSYVYAADGTLIATLYAEQNRQPIPLNDVPDHVVDVILAVEDESFYAHDGVNLRSTLRALATNVGSGDVSQGGSTITQQLVKAAFVGNEQSLERKAKEALLAIRLEEEMTKDELLERYLNTVYLGNSAYGLQAAAETYFGIDARELDIAQGALLAALIRAPSTYDPVRFPDRAVARRRIALDRLVEVSGVTRDAAELYARTPLPTRVTRFLPPPDDYFVEEVKKQLLRDTRLGVTKDERERAVFRGGLRIYTTFDPRAQQEALRARNDVIATVPGATTPTFPLLNEGVPTYGTAAIVSVEPGTGAVRAMVGGPGFDKYKYNITTQGIGRQTGSAFKTYVLMTLLEHGYVPNDSVSGSSPCSFPNPGGTPDPYVASNFGGSGGGGGTITSQTQRSSNCAYLRLGQIVGLRRVAAMAKRMGVTSAFRPELSMPLGTFEIRPIEMAAAYATIAADGMYSPPYYIDRVLDRDGGTIFEHAAAATRAFSVQSARLAAEVLRKNVEAGTGTRARLPAHQAAGKTGTAEDSGDAWFVGITKNISTAVWMGSPDGRVPMVLGGRGVTGGSYPAMIWGQYMTAWHDGQPVIDFVDPERTRSGRGLSLDRAIDPRGGSYYTPAPYIPPVPTGPTTSTTRRGPTTTHGPTTTVPKTTTSFVCTPSTSTPGGEC